MNQKDSASTSMRQTNSVPSVGESRLPPLRSRRRPLWIAAGVLCLVLGALGGVALFTQTTDSQTVVQVLHPVARGEVIEPSHLGLVTIGATPGVSVVSSDRVADLVGRTALVDLEPRSLLTEGSIGDPVVEPGKVHLGLRLPPGRLPVSELTPGTEVLLIPVPGPNGSQPTHTSAISAVVGTRPQSTIDGTAMVLDVSVHREHAELVAVLAASDNLTLVRVS